MRGLNKLAQISHLLLQSSDDVTQGADDALCTPEVLVAQAVVPELFVEAPVELVEAPFDGALQVQELLVEVVEAPVGGTLLVNETLIDGVETSLLCLRVGGG